MTQHRNDPGKASNFFDAIVEGIAPRGSSLGDIDGCYHDEPTDRFLVLETKHPHEPDSNMGQWRMLVGLAAQPRITVWHVRNLGEGWIKFIDMGTASAKQGERETVADVITVDDYRRRFDAFWHPKPVAAPLDKAIAAHEIRWGMR